MTHLPVELTRCSGPPAQQLQTSEKPNRCHLHSLSCSTRNWSQPEQTQPARDVRIGNWLLAEVVSLASFTALFTSPKQHAPERFLTSHAHRPAFTSAVMRAGMLELPVSATSRRTSARLKLKQ